MRNVLIVLVMIALFAFGYFIAGRIGGFVETNYQPGVARRNRPRRVFVTFASGKSARETAEQIKTLGNAYGGCVDIVCDAKKTDIAEYLDPEWCEIESRYKIG